MAVDAGLHVRVLPADAVGDVDGVRRRQRHRRVVLRVMLGEAHLRLLVVQPVHALGVEAPVLVEHGRLGPGALQGRLADEPVGQPRQVQHRRARREDDRQEQADRQRIAPAPAPEALRIALRPGQDRFARAGSGAGRRPARRLVIASGRRTWPSP